MSSSSLCGRYFLLTTFRLANVIPPHLNNLRSVYVSSAYVNFPAFVPFYCRLFEVYNLTKIFIVTDLDSVPAFTVMSDMLKPALSAQGVIATFRTINTMRKSDLSLSAILQDFNSSSRGG